MIAGIEDVVDDFVVAFPACKACRRETFVDDATWWSMHRHWIAGELTDAMRPERRPPEGWWKFTINHYCQHRKDKGGRGTCRVYVNANGGFGR